MIINEPQVMLMDEPFGALDAITRNRLQEELIQIMGNVKHTTIFVTHSVDEAIFLGDRIVVLTKRPGTVKSIIEPKIPKPRDRNSPEIVEMKKEILKIL
jgi:ABC-type nitrate/sulfonate/bicarbonate transport system ATPase subunit